MTVMEALLEGLKVTVVGLTIVFSVLIILMIILKLFEKIFYKKPEMASAPVAAAPVVAEPVATEAIEEVYSDEEELIAVLTAAVAACLDKPVGSIRINSYKRVSGSAWNKAGIRDSINNRF